MRSPLPKYSLRAVSLSVKRTEDILGITISASRIKGILSRLGFSVMNKGIAAFNVFVPSHRQDVCGDIDLIEEIARIEGYNLMPSSHPAVKLQFAWDNTFKRITESKKILTGLGLERGYYLQHARTQIPKWILG